MEKQIIDHIPMCYSANALEAAGKTKLIYAGEGDGSLYVYDGPNFSQKHTIWDEQDKLGGTMSIVVPEDLDDCFFASTGFFTMVESENSAIWFIRKVGEEYTRQCLCKIPYLHRFDIARVGSRRFLIACTLHSGKTVPEDWSTPGKLLWAELPLSPKDFAPLQIHVLREDLFQNHGFSRINDKGVLRFGIATGSGVYLATPPQSDVNQWTVEQIFNFGASDLCAWDLDGDGQLEYGLIRPFHGDQFQIYRLHHGKPELAYDHPNRQPFTHAIYAGILGETPCFVVGARGGAGEIFTVSYKNGNYCSETIAQDAGPSNVRIIHTSEGSMVMAANRQWDEAAIYRFHQQT